MSRSFAAARRSSRSARAALIALLTGCAGAAPLSAQTGAAADSSVASRPRSNVRGPDSAARPRWSVTAAYELDRPTGWVQVRENAIQGTRLSLERDLGIRAMSTATVTVRMPVGAGALALAVSGITLNGSAVLGDSVHFNGSTLMGGTVLKTRTEPPDFTRVVIGYEHRMLRIGRGGDVVGRVGLDATFLNFRLRGTLSPTSVGHETKEDFVTQELPCPFVGAAVRLPVGDRLMLDLSADGGGLPWVSSLRYEGGLVSLTQRRLDGRAGFDVALTPGFSAGAGFDYTSFIQNEQSHEDGNQIMLGGVGGSLRLTWKF